MGTIKNGKFIVFISWSSISPAKEIAEVIYELLKEIFSTVEDKVSFFYSDKEIAHGDKFYSILTKKLAESNFGILVITKNNFNNPWILYEAGALSKLEKSSVIPLLLGGLTVEKIEDAKSPLRQFQSITDLHKDKFIGVVRDICVNKIHINSDLTETITKTTERKWGNFKKRIDDILNNADYAKDELSSMFDTVLYKGAGVVTDNDKKMLQKNTFLWDETVQRINELLRSKNQIEHDNQIRDEVITDILRELESHINIRRLIFFGGIATKIRGDEFLRTLASWLPLNENSKVFFCHEVGDAVDARERDVNDKDVREKKIGGYGEMSKQLKEMVGDKYKKNVIDIKVTKPLSLYIVIIGDKFHFTPTLTIRSSETFTITFTANSKDGNRNASQLVDYMLDRVDVVGSDANNKLFKKELDEIKEHLNQSNVEGQS